MSWNDVLMQLVQALLPVLTLAIIMLVSYAIAYLRKRTSFVNNQIIRSTLDEALAEADKVMVEAINYTNQVFVDDLKKASADGKLTKDEAMQAMNKAKEYFLSHISGGSKAILESALGPIETWLKESLEAKIAQQKSKSSIAVRVNEIANPT